MTINENLTKPIKVSFYIRNPHGIKEAACKIDIHSENIQILLEKRLTKSQFFFLSLCLHTHCVLYSVEPEEFAI